MTSPLATLLALILTVQSAPAQRGKVLFDARCALCHVEASAPGLKAPLAGDLRRYRPDQIRDALTIGEMVDNAIGLNDQDIEDIAEYLTGKRPAPAN